MRLNIDTARAHYLLAAALLSSLSCAPLSADEQTPEMTRADDRRDVLEEFEVAKNGDVLLVPVRFGDGRTFRFLLDMACPFGWIDTELQQYVQATGQSAPIRGQEPMLLYRLVDAHVGRLPVGANCLVGCADLSYLREGLGYDIRGTVGMNFLRNYAVEIQFDLGRLAFLKRAGCERGTAVPLSYSYGWPVVDVQVGRELVCRFQFGTTMAASDECEMRKEDLDALATRGDFSVSAPVAWTTRAATRPQTRAGCLDRVDLAGFAMPNVPVHEGTGNYLTLAFLARYRATFDFPESRLILEKSPGFDEQRCCNITPIGLRRLDGGTVIRAVAPDRLAGAADIKPGDRLLEIDGRNVDAFTLYEVRGMLLHSPGSVNLKVERDGVVRECRLVLRGRGNEFSASAPRGAAGSAFDSDNVIEEFKVARHGGFLLVPVQFEDGPTAQFVLETGSTGVCVDTDLHDQLLETLDRVRINATHREPLYGMRPARVGRLPLPSTCEAVCRDLSDLRAVIGHDVRGVLGMEFMAAHVIHIDFDAGRLRFLKRAGVPLGCSVVRLSYSRGCPTLDVSAGSHPMTGFLLATGLDGSCILRKDHFETLQRHAGLRLDGEGFGWGLFGREDWREGVVPSFEFAAFEHHDVVVRERKVSAIGLELLSRYRVTFDFPGARLYLEKGARFDEPPPADLAGMAALTRTGAGTVVQMVTENSPAAAAGVRVGDRVVELYGRPIEQFPLDEVRWMLSESGRTVRLKVEREGAIRECRLKLGGAWAGWERP